jgi:uncharacterized protein YrrD
VSVLLRAAELVQRPVVTLAGDEVAKVKDVIYSSSNGELAGFTLNGLGLFSGPMRKTLPWENVHGLGPDAVMIRDETSLADRKALRGETEGSGGAVLGSAVFTESGRNLGVVTDVILDVGEKATDAVGYEIEPSDKSAPRHQFVPLPDTLSVSGEALLLPDSALDFIRNDLAGFGAAVEEFRDRLRRQEPTRTASEPQPAEAGARNTTVTDPAPTAPPAADPPTTDPSITDPRATDPSASDPPATGPHGTRPLETDRPDGAR